MSRRIQDEPIKGRGSRVSPDPRYASVTYEDFDDGWDTPAESVRQTELFIDNSRSIITYNQSPDVPFDRSINPYKGCEHGCSYCFARPTHAWLDMSPGLDFETRIAWKPDAPELLREALSKKNYRPAPIALGINTDAYQPIERKLKLTRSILEVLLEFRHPVSIVTKSALIERDLDILKHMAEMGLIEVMLSVTSLDHELSRKMEPRAASPNRRLQTLRALSEAGIPVGVLFAPVIPALNDSEMEGIVSASASAGAESAGYVILRLPHEIKELFEQWLADHYPLKAGHVMNIIRDLRNGQLYDASFGQRMTGSGAYASLISQRFKIACKQHGMNKQRWQINCDHFRVPAKSGQLGLF